MDTPHEQLSLALAPVEPFALDYFVSHSGVCEAARALEQAAHEVAGEHGCFRILFIWGPPGSGKTHLAAGCRASALKSGYPAMSVRLFCADASTEHESQPEEQIGGGGSFIAAYDEMKAGGGLIVITSRRSPGESTANPHLTSRYSAGSVLKVAYPRDDELQPVLASLSERCNLRLSDRSMQYLLHRLPADPLSFVNIFKRINEISFAHNKRAGLGVMREIFARKQP
ncbi:MAG TPA: hypothetical protein PLP17_05995 [Oligoflexia bacterium]|nr:hypothetical protein [Oligoflexia bacterium]